MAKNRRKKKPQGRSDPASAAVPVARAADKSAAGSSTIMGESVRQKVEGLIAQGKTKAAVDFAKLAHKELASEASESILVDAYEARIRGMIDKGMIVEARALIDVVRDRHPSAAARVGALRLDMTAHSGGYDDLLRPLADPHLDPGERQRIEDVVLRRASDLKALAECGTLPADHPFCRAATAAWEAFIAVTSGPVEESALALPEISRRGPLASWKPLIRAIASFHREDDASCERFLGQIDPNSAASRLVPALRALMDGSAGTPGNPRQEELARAVAGVQGELRPLLDRVDRFCEREDFYSDDPKGLEHIRRAALACARLSEDEGRRLRLILWNRAYDESFYLPGLDAAFSPPILRDAAFWRARACYMEQEPHAPLFNPLGACAAWNEFLSHAVREGWFPAKGPETACVLKRILANRLDIDPEDFEDELAYYSEDPDEVELLYRGQPRRILEAASKDRHEDVDLRYYVYPEQLLARIAEAYPTKENFKVWLSWAKKNNTKKEVEAVAERWREACPRYTNPLLYLMESAEDRGAYKKALGYLSEAEKLDALRPEVRQAQVRLNMAAFVRHCHDRKLHLAVRDIDAVAAVPTLDGQERRAVESVLRATLAAADGKPEEAESHRRAAEGMLNEPLATEVLHWGVAKICRLSGKDMPSLQNTSGKLPAGARVRATARAMALGKSACIDLPFPDPWRKALKSELVGAGSSLEPHDLRPLADGLLTSNERELAFLATCPGLAKDGSHLAHFLLLRARTLPKSYEWRRRQCVTAAISLARAQRAFDVVSEAVDLLNNEIGRSYHDPMDKLDMEEEHRDHVLEHERKERTYVSGRDHGYARERRYYQKCGCEDCREERRYGPSYTTGASTSTQEDPWKEAQKNFEAFVKRMPKDKSVGDIPRTLKKELALVFDLLRRSGRSEKEILEVLVAHMAGYFAEQGASENDDYGVENQGELFENFPF